MKDDSNLIGHLKQYWFVYAFAVQFVINYSFVNTTLSAHAKRLDILEIKVEKADLNLTEIKTTLAEIKTSIKYIEQKIK